MYSPQIQHVGVRLASLPFLVRGALPLTVFTQSGPDPLCFNFQVLAHNRPTAKAHHWMIFFSQPCIFNLSCSHSFSLRLASYLASGSMYPGGLRVGIQVSVSSDRHGEALRHRSHPNIFLWNDRQNHYLISFKADGPRNPWDPTGPFVYVSIMPQWYHAGFCAGQGMNI